MLVIVWYVHLYMKINSVSYCMDCVLVSKKCECGP